MRSTITRVEAMDRLGVWNFERQTDKRIPEAGLAVIESRRPRGRSNKTHLN
jgi:hypothetical protein